MKRKTGNLNISLYESFVKRAVEGGLKEIGLYSTGEPFMTKNLHEFIAIAKKNGIKRVYIDTNGALATIDKVKKCVESGLDSMKFSINAGSRETYKIIHGFDDFDKVVKNLKDIYNYKIKNNINLQLMASFVYTDLTFNEIDKFKDFFFKYFEDVKIVGAHNQGGRTLDTARKITKNSVKKINDEKKTIKPCAMLWNTLHLTAEGYLTACCVDYENDLTYKKFDEKESILDQFNHENMRKLRRMHLTNNLDGTICKGCLYNTNESYTGISNLPKKEVKKVNTNKNLDLQKRISQSQLEKF